MLNCHGFRRFQGTVWFEQYIAAVLMLPYAPVASMLKFTVGVSPETLRRTNLGLLGKGRYAFFVLFLYLSFSSRVVTLWAIDPSPVNVERALKADGRNSGHFVQVSTFKSAFVVCCELF